MHATIEQLLNYRDDLPLAAESKQHIQICEICNAQLIQLCSLQNAFQGLPDSILTPDELDASWDKVTTELNQSKPSGKPFSRYWPAVAAGLLAAVFIFAMSQNKNELLQEKLANLTVTPVTSNPMPAVQVTPGSIADSGVVDRQLSDKQDLAQLVAYSRLLESRLQALPQPRLVRANTAGTISQLQDQISVLDSRLNLDHQIPLTESQRNALWQQRVNSMNNLYRVRSAQLQRVTY